MRQVASLVRAGLALMVATPVVAALSVLPLAGAPVAVAAGQTAVFQPLTTPTRLADTRVTGRVGEGVTINVKVTGDAPLPAAGSIVAAVLNVTVVGPANVGFWTVFPHGSVQPTASNINVDAAAAARGETLALPNMVTVPVPSDGFVDIYSFKGGHVVVDVLGYYLPATGPVSAGRLTPLAAPSRLVDTRDTNNALWPSEARTFVVPGAAGASAVALNVTTIGLNSGYWQVFAAGTTPSVSSNVNTMFPGHVAANQVIVPVDATGAFSVFSLNGGHLIVDVVGTFTGAGAPPATDGAFVSLPAPTRFLDTRTGKRLFPSGAVELPIASNAAIGVTEVAAVALNLTVTDTFAPGYVSASPAGTNKPETTSRPTSTINATALGQTLANHAIVPVSTRGIEIFAQSPTHVIADVSGYYLGAPVAAPFGVPANVDPTPLYCLSFTNEVLLPASQGAAGPNVAALQQRLLDLGFWNGGADGKYGWTTQQAVMAYQKWNALPVKSGAVDATTASRLSYPNCKPVPGTDTGDLFEIDKGRQVGVFIRGGKLLWIVNVSTGGGYFYEDEINGEKFIDRAITDSGNFKVYRVVDTPRYEGTLGTMYRPRFVVRGIAVHGAPNVPNYPASHGCIRVSNPAMDLIWSQNLLPMGGRVWIHD